MMFVKSMKQYMQGNSHFTSAMDLTTREEKGHFSSIPIVTKKTKQTKKNNKQIRTNISKL